jgi:hypothetical protein
MTPTLTGIERQNAAGTGAESYGILTEAEAAELRVYFKPCLDALEFAWESVGEVKFNCPASHLIYFVGSDGGAIKIGFTQQPIKARLKCIQNGSPVKLHVLATQNAPRERERVYHDRFRAHRLHGEWFTPHPDILAEIERLSA